ncbi:MAG: soluble NSF attachment family protein [Clostridiales bacterium]|jgi:tetratricopeptide (TPR) repeat protein|nr:soluble NSF attachment family protein [Clostridiales bacterium]
MRKVSRRRGKKPSRVLTFMERFVVSVTVITLLSLSCCGDNRARYDEANRLMQSDPIGAAVIFDALGDYRDAETLAAEARDTVYWEAADLMKAENYAEAAEVFASLGEYQNAAELALEARNRYGYNTGVAMMNRQEYLEAAEQFDAVGGFLDAGDLAEAARLQVYNRAAEFMDAGEYGKAITEFSKLGGFMDSAERLASCEKILEESGIYDETVAAFTAGDFAKAAERCEQLPEEYEDAGLFAGSIRALNYYENENWLSAARIYDDLMRKTAETPREISDVWEKMSVQIETIETGGGEAAPLSLGDLFSRLYFESLFRYYEENIRLGNDIFTLPEYPYAWPDDDGGFGWLNYGGWRVREAASGIQERELAEYYKSTDASVSPVGLTGEKLFVVTGNAPRNTSWYHKILRAVPPFFLAEKPEEIRYVLNFSESYAKYGTYTDGAAGYIVSTQVTLKDTSDGSILFSKTYDELPPEKTTLIGDVYGIRDFSEDLRVDILPELEKIFPVYWE